jgi:hypothetical protein
MFDFDVVTGSAGQTSAGKTEPKEPSPQTSPAGDEERPRPDNEHPLNAGNAACR